MSDAIVTNTQADLDGKTLLTAEAFPTAGLSNLVYTSAFASPPTSPQSGDVWLPSDAPLLLRYSGSVWVPWGPLFALTDPTLQSFSWVNQGGATVSSANGGLYMDVPAGAGDNLRCQVKSAPSTPYTVTAGFLADLRALDYNAFGLCFRESGSGKLHLAAIGSQSATSTGIGAASYKYTSPTAFSAAYVSGSAFALIPGGALLWIRIQDTGVNRVCSVSRDGLHWRQVHSVARTDFLTADQVGWFGSAENATAGPLVTLLSWRES